MELEIFVKSYLVWILSKGKWDVTEGDKGYSRFGQENEFEKSQMETESSEEVVVVISLLKPQ